MKAEVKLVAEVKAEVKLVAEVKAEVKLVAELRVHLLAEATVFAYFWIRVLRTLSVEVREASSMKRD